MNRLRMLTLAGGLIMVCLPCRVLADSAEAHLGRAYLLVQDQRYEDAAAEFQAALTIDPSLLRARYQLAICRFAHGDQKEARREFESLPKESQADAGVVYYLGRLDLLANHYQSAAARFGAIAAKPPFPDTAFYLGLAWYGQGDLPQAAHWLAEAAQLAPRDFRTHYRLARIYHDLGREAEAKKEYALSSELRQGYQEGASQALDCSQALKGQPSGEARAVCRKLYDPNDPDKLTMLGLTYGQAGAYQEAIEPLQAASRLDPESFEIWHNLGLSYFRLRKYHDAREPLEKAVALRPDFFGSNALLGAVLYSLKDDAAAYRTLDHAHHLDPRDADTSKLLLQLAGMLGQEASAAKDFQQALVYLRRAIELGPADAGLHRRLAAVYAQLGREQDALRETEAAKHLDN